MLRNACVLLAVAALLVTTACNGDGGGGTPPASPTSAAVPSVTVAPAATPSPGAGPPAIVIDKPALGDIVSVPFLIAGTADVFEATLQVQATAADGTVICQHTIMATSGSGTRGDWSTVMAFPPPLPPAGNSAVPMVVRAFDYSARDGSEENIVSVEMNVSGQRPPNVITSPGCNARIPRGSTLQATGVTDAFEGALQLEVRDLSGNVALTQAVQASGGTGAAPWNASLALTSLAPGEYMLVAFDLSARDGSRQNEFGVPITILP